MAAELDHLEETQSCAVAFVELGATSQINAPAPRIWTDPDAVSTSERDDIYAWLRELACPRDDLAHTHTSMFGGRDWSTGGQARARWHNAIMAAELGHLAGTSRAGYVACIIRAE